MSTNFREFRIGDQQTPAEFPYSNRLSARAQQARTSGGVHDESRVLHTNDVVFPFDPRIIKK